MVTLLLTSVFIIGFLGLALYFWAKPSKSERVALPPPHPSPRGLFSEPETIDPAAPADADEIESERSALLERAESGDKQVLDEAQALADKNFYNQVLELMVAAARTDAGLLSLVSYVARQELPVNYKLAQAVVDSWNQTPNRNSTAKALHVTALADDAGLYQNTVAAALQYWRSGRLADVTPAELQALFDGEFWVLSSRTRSSGAGFILKRTLASARRELGNATSTRK